MRITAALIAPAVFLAALLSATSAAQAQDRIHQPDNPRPTVGEVTAEQIDFIKYRPPGIDQEVEIERRPGTRVEYEDWPRRLDSVQDALASGDARTAMSLLEQVREQREDRKIREWVEQYIRYYTGAAQMVGGDPKAAVQTIDALLDEQPRTVFLAEALGIKAQALLQQGRGAEALAPLDQLKDLVDRYNLSKEVELETDLNRARVFMALDRWDEADDALQSVTSAGSRHPELAAKAQALMGDVLLGQGKHAAAERHYGEMLRSEDLSPSVRPAAWNGMGEARYGQGEWKQALYAHLRVWVLYRDVDMEENARALYNAAMCYVKLAGSDNDYKKRAQRHFQLCMGLPISSPRALEYKNKAREQARLLGN